MDIVIIETTVGSEVDASGLANLILTRRLAACIQCESIESVFHWKHAVKQEQEIRLTCKTSVAAADALVQCIQTHHPYAVPEILRRHADASEAYGQWLQNEVAHG